MKCEDCAALEKRVAELEQRAERLAALAEPSRIARIVSERLMYGPDAPHIEWGSRIVVQYEETPKAGD